jgi:hypothetical protein
MEKHVFTDIMTLQQEEGWRSVRCICGALSGRSQEQVTESGETVTLYRLTKFAIRPVSPSAACVMLVLRLSSSWLNYVCVSGRVGYRSLRLSSKIWLSLYAPMPPIDL